MKKKIVSTTIIVLSLLFLGFAMWYLYPFSKFGAIVLYDHYQAHVAKSDVKEYVEETYGEKMEIKDYSYDGEARIDLLVTSVYKKTGHETYTIYYDIKQDKVLFDEFQLEKEANSYLNAEMFVSAGGEKVRKEQLKKSIREQEHKIQIVEKEIEKARLTNSTKNEQKVKLLEAHLDKEYEHLGFLKNTYDALLTESRG